MPTATMPMYGIRRAISSRLNTEANIGFPMVKKANNAIATIRIARSRLMTKRSRIICLRERVSVNESLSLSNTPVSTSSATLNLSLGVSGGLLMSHPLVDGETSVALLEHTGVPHRRLDRLHAASTNNRHLSPSTVPLCPSNPGDDRGFVRRP